MKDEERHQCLSKRGRKEEEPKHKVSDLMTGQTTKTDKRVEVLNGLLGKEKLSERFTIS